MTSYQTWKSNTSKSQCGRLIPYMKEEREMMAEADRLEIVQQEEADAAILSWTASNGSAISVHYAKFGHGFDVIVDGALHSSCEMVTAPAQYQAVGIVAKLGPVGLTAERKSVLESK